VRLGVPGTPRHLVLDTTHFVGNAPGEVLVTDPNSGLELLPRTPLLPDTEHRFLVPPAPGDVRSVRLDAFPDGGLARLRVLGEIPDSPGVREEIVDRWLGLLPPGVAASADRAEFFA